MSLLTLPSESGIIFGLGLLLLRNSIISSSVHGFLALIDDKFPLEVVMFICQMYLELVDYHDFGCYGMLDDRTLLVS
jgi:hypothetical protein